VAFLIDFAFLLTGQQQVSHNTLCFNKPLLPAPRGPGAGYDPNVNKRSAASQVSCSAGRARCGIQNQPLRRCTTHKKPRVSHVPCLVAVRESAAGWMGIAPVSAQVLAGFVAARAPGPPGPGGANSTRRPPVAPPVPVLPLAAASCRDTSRALSP